MVPTSSERRHRDLSPLRCAMSCVKYMYANEASDGCPKSSYHRRSSPTCNGHLLSLSVYHTDRRWRTTEQNPPRRRRRPVLYSHRRRRTTPPCLERRTRRLCKSCWSAPGTRWYRTMDSASTDRHRIGRLTSHHRHAAVRSSSGKYHATALRYR